MSKQVVHVQEKLVHTFSRIQEMSRRQSSQSSLSRYARASDAGELENRSMDFCNAFWGINDPGYEVLLARMRIAGKTVDDLRNFWKERAAIEDEYAKRLVRLSKQALGQDEVAELKNSLDAVRQETERQAGQHLSLSLTIRKELERSANDFAMKQAHHKKTFQAPIEKTFKQKQQNEHYVVKAKEHYEQECHRVNSYTAQKALVQGKELEKIHLKLEKAQSIVEGNKRDYQNFTRALADTVARWDKEWKSFCDQCQDLEEERLEFMKDNIWAYANAVSTVCVNEDESCEAMRVALERLEVEKDIEYFIINHGTGPAIPEPPPFINYAASEPTPLKPLTRVANFARSTTRPRSIMGSLANANSPPEDEPIDAGTAGIGTQHIRGASQILAQNAGMSPPQLPPQNTISPIPSASVPNIGYHQPSTSVSSVPGQGPYSMPTMAPTSNRRGSFQAPPNNISSPPAEQGYSVGTSSYKSPTANQVGGPGDPIADMLGKLRENPTGDTISRRGGTIGRTAGQNHQATSSNQSNSYQSPGSSYHNNGASMPTQGGFYPNHQPSSSISGGSNRPVSPGSSALSPPGGVVDYHAQADAIVGAHPSSRPASPAGLNPAPPHAALMQPNSVRSPSPIDKALANYHQQFPEEHKERRLSRNGSFNTEGQQGGRPNDKNLPPRSNSPGGFAGVGAGRSPSPQPVRSGASPAPPKSPQFNTGSLGPGRATSPQTNHTKSLRRAASPAAGILFDANGNVISDEMAERWNGNQLPQQPPAQPPKQQPPTTSQPANPYPSSRWQSPYPVQQQAPTTQPPATSSNHNSWTGFAPPPAPPPLSNPATSPYPSYGQSQPPVNSGPPSTGGYQSYQQPTTYQHPQQPLQSQPAAQNPGQRYPTPGTQTRPPPNQAPVAAVQNTGYTNPGYGMSNQGSNYLSQGVGHGPGPTQENLSMMGSQPVAPQVQGGPQERTPSPMPPTRNFIEDRGILFYVKALYDYTATIEEEFDFQAGDVIAVLATPDDGWWQGILLDDSRRQPGRTVFPSNFVCLF